MPKFFSFFSLFTEDLIFFFFFLFLHFAFCLNFSLSYLLNFIYALSLSLALYFLSFLAFFRLIYQVILIPTSYLTFFSLFFFRSLSSFTFLSPSLFFPSFIHLLLCLTFPSPSPSLHLLFTPSNSGCHASMNSLHHIYPSSLPFSPLTSPCLPSPHLP